MTWFVFHCSVFKVLVCCSRKQLVYIITGVLLCQQLFCFSFGFVSIVLTAPCNGQSSLHLCSIDNFNKFNLLNLCISQTQLWYHTPAFPKSQAHFSTFFEVFSSVSWAFAMAISEVSLQSFQGFTFHSKLTVHQFYI